MPRKTIYPNVEVRVFENPELFKQKQSKALLGWEVVPERKQSILTDRNGLHIRCSNVGLQRIFYPNEALKLMWEILKGNWQFNLESIIIGKTGLVLEGKHRLTALVWACQEYAKEPGLYPFWSKEPSIEVLIALGGKETAKVVNTIGTGKPRSIADSLFASDVFCGEASVQKINRMTKMAEFAVRTLWSRTGANANAFNPRISHSDALDFLDEHPNVLHCIRTIEGENSGKHKRVAAFTSLGTACGLLYLMGSCDSDSKRYSKEAHERVLSFAKLEQAETYWYHLARRNPETKGVVQHISRLERDGNNSSAERTATIVKGWNLFRKGKKLTPTNVRPRVTVANGSRCLAENPICGGIDLGGL